MGLAVQRDAIADDLAGIVQRGRHFQVGKARTCGIDQGVEVQQGAAVPEHGVLDGVARQVRAAHHETAAVDGARVAVLAAQGAQVHDLAVAPQRGVRDVGIAVQIAGADHMAGTVDAGGPAVAAACQRAQIAGLASGVPQGGAAGDVCGGEAFAHREAGVIEAIDKTLAATQRGQQLLVVAGRPERGL
ncbi:hypothetical protein DAPPUDRAFT_344355, partial [Daphnia pulex]